MFEAQFQKACQRWNVLANQTRDRFEEEEFQELTKTIEQHHYVKAHPFYCYTRRYKKNGDCVKGFRRFKSRAAQQRFMFNTTAAVTAYN
jgi:hypothetical protein